MFIGFSGMFVLLLEYTPSKYRSAMNSSVLFFWAVGYLLIDLTAYLIKRLVLVLIHGIIGKTIHSFESFIFSKIHQLADIRSKPLLVGTG